MSGKKFSSSLALTTLNEIAEFCRIDLESLSHNDKLRLASSPFIINLLRAGAPLNGLLNLSEEILNNLNEFPYGYTRLARAGVSFDQIIKMTPYSRLLFLEQSLFCVELIRIGISLEEVAKLNPYKQKLLVDNAFKCDRIMRLNSLDQQPIDMQRLILLINRDFIQRKSLAFETKTSQNHYLNFLSLLGLNSNESSESISQCSIQ